jgi:hypothetical protein
MISRDQIEKILKVNGVAPGSPDEQIRSILLSARYGKDEVDTAIMVLREDTKTRQTRVDGLHKVFRSTQALKPEEISHLLGIDVTIGDTIVNRNKQRNFTIFQYVFVWVLSVVVAVTGILAYMYLHEIGVFHPSVQLTSSR